MPAPTFYSRATSSLSQGSPSYPEKIEANSSVRPPGGLTYFPINAGRNLEYKRKNQQLLNLKKYPFHRAVHYFFDLNIFPRCEGHISYAIDQNNALQNTFSNDQNELKKCNYGSILNRKLFGLPVDEKFI